MSLINKLSILLLEHFHSGASVIDYDGSGRYIEIYKDPSYTELDNIFEDEKGLGGCRIGIDKIGNIWCWTDTIDHSKIEAELKNKFVNGKLVYPAKNSNYLVVSTGYSDDEEAFKSWNQKYIKKLMLVFDKARFIKDNDLKIIYTNN